MKTILKIIFSLYLILISNIQASETKLLQDTTKPVINHYPSTYCSRYSWPKFLSTYATDSSGIDSVWVKWYKNNPVTMNRRFKLNKYYGGYFGAYFNSVFSDVNYGDIIFYRIFAQDSSLNHNLDSTQLYAMTITEGTECRIGNGIDTSNYPFTTYWMDGRTQMLFTASELATCGYIWNIQKIGFHVISFSSQVMNGFTIRFQTTTQTSLTGFVFTGWTTVYSGTYTVSDTGWQFVNLTSNYSYNQNSNLLVEICFDNSSYTQYSKVSATQAPGMTWGYYTDNASGCTMSSGSTQSKRPNIILVYQNWIGVNPIKSEIPGKFKLYQNYPNPFNPVSRIDFDLPKSGFVNLRVFDILGREVRTIINEEKTAGTYSVDFNASDLSSGVYFYKLCSGDFSEIKKMILFK